MVENTRLQRLQNLKKALILSQFSHFFVSKKIDEIEKTRKKKALF